MILKLILVIGVIAAVYFFFFKKSTPLTKERHENKKKRTDDSETMVECVTCSTYISTHEAIVSSGRFYCSTECRDKDQG